MIGTLRYVIQQLSKDDFQFTIDMLIDEVVTLEEKLDRNEKAVNELNLENKEFRKKIERYEKSLEEINQMAVYYDEKGWALNPDKVGSICIKALDR